MYKMSTSEDETSVLEKWSLLPKQGLDRIVRLVIGIKLEICKASLKSVKNSRTSTLDFVFVRHGVYVLLMHNITSGRKPIF